MTRYSGCPLRYRRSEHVMLPRQCWVCFARIKMPECKWCSMACLRLLCKRYLENDSPIDPPSISWSAIWNSRRSTKVWKDSATRILFQIIWRSRTAKRWWPEKFVPSNRELMRQTVPTSVSFFTTSACDRISEIHWVWVRHWLNSIRAPWSSSVLVILGLYLQSNTLLERKLWLQWLTLPYLIWATEICQTSNLSAIAPSPAGFTGKPLVASQDSLLNSNRNVNPKLASLKYICSLLFR